MQRAAWQHCTSCSRSIIHESPNQASIRNAAFAIGRAAGPCVVRQLVRLLALLALPHPAPPLHCTVLLLLHTACCMLVLCCQQSVAAAVAEHDSPLQGTDAALCGGGRDAPAAGAPALALYSCYTVLLLHLSLDYPFCKILAARCNVQQAALEPPLVPTALRRRHHCGPWLNHFGSIVEMLPAQMLPDAALMRPLMLPGAPLHESTHRGHGAPGRGSACGASPGGTGPMDGALATSKHAALQHAAACAASGMPQQGSIRPAKGRLSEREINLKSRSWPPPALALAAVGQGQGGGPGGG